MDTRELLSVTAQLTKLSITVAGLVRERTLEPVAQAEASAALNNLMRANGELIAAVTDRLSS